MFNRSSHRSSLSAHLTRSPRGSALVALIAASVVCAPAAARAGEARRGALSVAAIDVWQQADLEESRAADRVLLSTIGRTESNAVSAAAATRVWAPIVRSSEHPSASGPDREDSDDGSGSGSGGGGASEAGQDPSALITTVAAACLSGDLATGQAAADALATMAGEKDPGDADAVLGAAIATMVSASDIASFCIGSDAMLGLSSGQPNGPPELVLSDVAAMLDACQAGNFAAGEAPAQALFAMASSATPAEIPPTFLADVGTAANATDATTFCAAADAVAADIGFPASGNGAPPQVQLAIDAAAEACNAGELAAGQAQSAILSGYIAQMPNPGNLPAGVADAVSAMNGADDITAFCAGSHALMVAVGD